MAQYITPWKCGKCGNSWFRKEVQERLLKATYSPGMTPVRYTEPGEEVERIKYVCVECGRELEELYT